MKTDHMGRKSFEKAGGLSPERIRQMDADIAQALSSERETGGVDVPSLKLLDAIDAKIRRRNRRSVAGAFAAGVPAARRALPGGVCGVVRLGA